jgi:hypothetical protein
VLETKPLTRIDASGAGCPIAAREQAAPGDGLGARPPPRVALARGGPAIDPIRKPAHDVHR